MAKKGGNPQNLVPFKKGNDERRNKDGRPEGQSLKSILDRLLERKIKVEDMGEVVEVTRKEAIALDMIVTALTDEDPNITMKAAKFIFDNTDPITKDVKLGGEVATTLKLDALTIEEKLQMVEILKKANGE